jgi:putative heme iron utilization protein
MAERNNSVLRELTPEAIAEAKALIREADHAALAVLEPETGQPLVSRVGLATLADGAPLIVVSHLAQHSAALDADPRCSLLVGNVGKGDPLAHPRITLICRAALLPPEERAGAREGYLAVHPRAAVYVDLPDFRFFRLEIERASFNGGFGRAYAIEGGALLG